MKTEENNKDARQELISTAAADFMDLYVFMQSATIAHWLMFELTFALARALIILSAKKTLTVSQLAKLLDVGSPTASILVQKLVERGLVTRTEDAADRRQTLLRLSEQGAEIGAGRRSERVQQWQGWLSHLSDVELSGLANGLRVLLLAAEAEARSTSEGTSVMDKTH